MMSKSENSVFSDANQLSKNNTGTFTGQHATPDFLFGSRNRRRSLIASFDSGTPENRPFEHDMLSVASRSSQSSNKSVHWSPTLTQTRSIASSGTCEDFSMDTDLDNSSLGPDISTDPPLRSMREELLLPQQMSKDSNSTTTSLSSLQTLDLQTQQEIAAHWVTVFGFSREDAAYILKLFARHGTIVTHRFPKDGNWIFLRYASPVHAQQALSRNGQIIDGRLRLGVVPVDNKEVMNLEDDDYNSFLQADNENSVLFNRNSRSMSTLMEYSSLNGIGPLASPNSASHPLDTSFNTSLIASSVRPGIRSLRASFNAIDNYYRVDEETEPTKSYGLWDKLWSFVA
ncbi:Nup53/35/40-type RNA recognition motif family protein [Acanthocheilonema viteae]